MFTLKTLPFLALLMTSTLDAQSITYPPTRKDAVVDDYHGTKVADPYRWLEDVDSPETHSWVEAQNRVTFGYLAQIPERERIRRRLTDAIDADTGAIVWRRNFGTTVAGSGVTIGSVPEPNGWVLAIVGVVGFLLVLSMRAANGTRFSSRRQP